MTKQKKEKKEKKVEHYVKKFMEEHPWILDDDIPDEFDKWMGEQK